MRRHADRQRHGALGATRLARLDGAIHGPGGAGDHDLARRVEVHRADHFALGGFGTGSGHVGIVQTEDCGHATGTGRHGFLHQLAAALHQFHRSGERQAAGSHQRGVLAQAMAGDERRSGAALALPQTPQGDGGGKNGRLGLVGLVQALFRAFLHQRPEVIAQGIGSFAEGFAHDGVLSALVGEHADRLRTLAGENECEGCGHCNGSLLSVSSEGETPA
ncbi:hypothetical protein D3C76_829880 [compost metagenome]